MSLNIPRQYESQIKEIASAQHISTDEALDRVIQAGLQRFVPPSKSPRVSYASLFGAATGPGTYKAREEVDRYISELRAEW
jgi:hypothetical protein